MTRKLLVAFVSLAFAGLLPISTLAQSIDDQERAIARELQCPVCENLSVADSPSQLAGQMRDVIRQKLETGESRDDILRYFAARYGEGILLSPPRSGFTLLVWTAPYVGVAAAVAFLVWAVRRRRPAVATDDAEGQDLDPYLSEVDATVDRLRDEPVR